jgi:hypothetical protein
LAHSDTLFDVDVLARKLIHMAAVYRQMGPSWDKGGITSLVAGAQGEYIGKALPGRGILLDSDLKSVGINRQLPGVFERSRFRRILDKLNDERGAISTYDGIISGRGNGKADDTYISKQSITTGTGSGFWYDLWFAPGTGGTGTYLATTAPTGQNRVHGAVGDWGACLTNPGGSDKKYLISLGWGNSTAHNWAILVDVLQDAGRFRLNPTAAETIAAPADIPSRLYGPSGTLGMGCQIVAPIDVVRGTPAAGTLQINYRNTASADTNTGAAAMSATADPIYRCLPFPSTNTGSPFISLAAGDVGVKRIISSTRAATSDASGSFVMKIVFPLVSLPGIAANTYVERDAPMNIDGLIELANASQVMGCLDMLMLAGGNASGAIVSLAKTVAG